MQEVFEEIIEKLKSESHWTESTFDEDGYCNDDSEEVVYLHNAIEIVNQVASEYGDKTTIDGQYCWQTCACTEMCDKCNRLSNGDIDYYESIEPYKAESEE